MYALAHSKHALAPSVRAKCERRRASVVVRCEHRGVDEARLEKLKEVAKRVVGDKRDNCNRAIVIFKDFMDAERAVYKTLVDELKELVREDVQRVRDHFTLSDKPVADDKDDHGEKSEPHN